MASTQEKRANAGIHISVLLENEDNDDFYLNTYGRFQEELQKPKEKKEIKRIPKFMLFPHVASASEAPIERKRMRESSTLKSLEVRKRARESLNNQDSNRRETSKHHVMTQEQLLENTKVTELKNSKSFDVRPVHPDFSKMLQDENTHDLILKVGDTEFRAHRDILTAQSRVFELLLHQNMIVGNNNAIIALPDCNAQAMEQFLSYVYYGKVETLDPSNMLSLYYVADKYDMQGLKEECSDFIKKSLSVNNLCDIFQLATNHSDCSLLECAVEYFNRNRLEVRRSEHWKSFLTDHTQLALQIIIKCFSKPSKYSRCAENRRNLIL